MDDKLGYFVLITLIVGWWAFMIIRSLARAKVRELEIRERIAMIEKGHVPPPEVDPRGFERALAPRHLEYLHSQSGYRHRRAGTALIGVGLGLTLMIGLAGENLRTGLGVGGFLVMLGLAFLANGLLDQRQMPPVPSKAESSGTSPSEPPKVQ